MINTFIASVRHSFCVERIICQRILALLSICIHLWGVVRKYKNYYANDWPPVYSYLHEDMLFIYFMGIEKKEFSMCKHLVKVASFQNYSTLSVPLKGHLWFLSDIGSNEKE